MVVSKQHLSAIILWTRSFIYYMENLHTFSYIMYSLKWFWQIANFGSDLTVSKQLLRTKMAISVLIYCVINIWIHISISMMDSYEYSPIASYNDIHFAMHLVWWPCFTSIGRYFIWPNFPLCWPNFPISMQIRVFCHSSITVGQK